PQKLISNNKVMDVSMQINKVVKILMLSALLLPGIVRPMKIDKMKQIQLATVVSAVLMEYYAGGTLIILPAMNAAYAAASVLIPTMAIGSVGSLALKSGMLPNV